MQIFLESIGRKRTGPALESCSRPKASDIGLRSRDHVSEGHGQRAGQGRPDSQKTGEDKCSVTTVAVPVSRDGNGHGDDGDDGGDDDDDMMAMKTMMMSTMIRTPILAKILCALEESASIPGPSFQFSTHVERVQ